MRLPGIHCRSDIDAYRAVCLRDELREALQLFSSRYATLPAIACAVTLTRESYASVLIQVTSEVLVCECLPVGNTGASGDGE